MYVHVSSVPVSVAFLIYTLSSRRVHDAVSGGAVTCLHADPDGGMPTGPVARHLPGL